jgi:hypothetical protein
MMKCEDCSAWALHLMTVKETVSVSPRGTPDPNFPGVMAVPAVLCYETRTFHIALCNLHLKSRKTHYDGFNYIDYEVEPL